MRLKSEVAIILKSSLIIKEEDDNKIGMERKRKSSFWLKIDDTLIDKTIASRHFDRKQKIKYTFQRKIKQQYSDRTLKKMKYGLWFYT